MKKLKERLSRRLSEKFGVPFDVVFSCFDYPDEKFGDLSTTLAFVIAKREKKNPAEVAERIEEIVREDPEVGEVRVIGPYVNIVFSESFFSRVREEKTERPKEKGERVIVEYPSVNPNKPWHVGHLRNALLGDVISRLLDWAGYDVVRLDYVNDLGLQVAHSILYACGKKPQGKFDHWLGKEYVEAARYAEEHPDEVKEFLKKLENGEVETERKWIVEECVKAQHETALAYGIVEDVIVFESDVMRELWGVGLERLVKTGVVVKEESGKNAGCYVVKFERTGMKEPDKVIVRSDGTATYTGKDIVFHLWKFGKISGLGFREFMDQGGVMLYASGGPLVCNFNDADWVINVIGAEQSYPQEVIRHCLRVLGLEKEAERLVHFAYEHAWSPEGKFSGRRGTWVGYTADELLEETVAEASKRGSKKVAKEVALGAIRFSFLRPDPRKKILFSWERALSFEGDSGPYLQYSYVRARKILEKCGERKGGMGYLTPPDERRLLKFLAMFEEVVLHCARPEKPRPEDMCEYGLKVAAAFNKFYTSTRVVGSEWESVRKKTVERFVEVMGKVLDLLGIPRPREM